MLKSEKNWIVYLVRCADTSLYCGITNDLTKRLKAHNLGKGAKYTRSRRPVELIGVSIKKTKSDALKLEIRVKRTPANRKLVELVNEETRTEMKNTQILQKVQTELHSVVKRIQLLVESVGNIVADIEKLGEKELSRGTKATRAPSRKKVVIKNGVVEKIKRIPAVKIVFDIIQNSAHGVDTATLMKATGFNLRKVHNITFRLKKEGKIKNEKRGVYKTV